MIQLGHFLPGASPLTTEKGSNETYRGIVEVGTARLAAYVKLLPDRQLVNELLASVLGQLVGLPLPRGFLVSARLEDYPSSIVLQESGQPEMPAFAVETIAHQSLNRRLDLVSKPARELLFRTWPHWYRAACFDDWIANADRHTGNLLVGGRGEIWLIDHSLAFTGPKWVGASLDPDLLTENQLCQAMSVCLTPSEKALVMQECHAAVQQFASINAVQAAHLAELVNLLEPSDLNSLTTFVSTRVGSVAHRIGACLGVPELPLGGVK